jgi:hypothetical protein
MDLELCYQVLVKIFRLVLRGVQSSSNLIEMELLRVRIGIHSTVGELILVVSLRVVLPYANFIFFKCYMWFHREPVLRLIAVSRGGLLREICSIAVQLLVTV